MSLQFLTDEQQAERLAARKRGQAAQVPRYSIEGELVTRKQMAERLGVSTSIIRGRMLRLKRKPEPITWEALK